MELASRNLSSFFVGALKRKAVEVSEKRLSPEDRARLQEAKQVEVKNIIAAKAFEVFPPELRCVTMGGVKPKARAVLLGYQDFSYEHRMTTAPVMTRQTRQLMLQLAANKKWRLMKGDVSGAFLQGREYPSELFCIPCDEICQAMNIAAGTVTRLKRACYGLVDAPLEWYKTVAEFLESLGLERLWSDSCAWVLRKEGQVRGMISGHVDDFMFAGGDSDVEWQGILKRIQEKFKWGDWDKDSFVQCGVQIETCPQGFKLSQPKYVDGIEAIHLSDHAMLITRQDSEMHFYAWVDAADRNRIDRACRSPGAAESAAAVNGEDALYYVRYQWSEMIYGQVDLRRPDTVVSRVPGCVVTDSRNVYDKLTTAMMSINGAEKRSNIELLSLKASQQTTGVIIRWVHSEAQLANALTKSQEHRELELYYRMQHQWRIVEDDAMRSARKRKAEGLQPLQQGTSAEK
ncbi:RE2 [Symbiodinium sp. CCMP2456]|nr:RE2 [Symbiodinium sp. CCMP2456]